MSKSLWYLGRGTGVSALVLLTLVIVLGIVVRSGRPLPGLPRFAVASIHRTTSLSAVGLLVLHVLTLSLDPYAQLQIVDLVLPFVSKYRPFWQGLGTLAAELLLILIVSSLLRHRLGLATWRGVHWIAYACWPLALAHAFGNGTDRHSSWLLAVLAGCLIAVAIAIGWRFSSADFSPEPSMEPMPAPFDLAGLQ
jgi:methionine sulfoxide reductase heme-binding subunit